MTSGAGIAGLARRAARLLLAATLALVVARTALARPDEPDAAQPPDGGDAPLLDLGGARTLEAALAQLPAALRSNYVLMFHSRSLQEASPAEPRVLLYSRDATLVVAFNANAAQRGGDALEVMRYDARSARFLFQELRFPAGAESSGPVASPLNPPQCLACHGAVARPIWDTYPAWPGAWGERYRAALPEEQADALRRFMAAREAHPRYRWLLQTGRYVQSLTASRRETYNRAAPEPSTFEFTQRLARLNLHSIAAQLAAAPDYPAFRHALLASVAPRCADPAAAFPDAWSAGVRREYVDWVRQTRSANDAQEAHKQARLQDAAARRDAGVDVESLDALRYLAQRWMGLDTSAWTLAFEKGTYDYAGPSSAALLHAFLLEQAARRDAGLAQLSVANVSDEDRRYCALLQRRSRESLAPLLERGSALQADQLPPQAPGVRVAAPQAHQ